MVAVNPGGDPNSVLLQQRCGLIPQAHIPAAASSCKLAARCCSVSRSTVNSSNCCCCDSCCQKGNTAAMCESAGVLPGAITAVAVAVAADDAGAVSVRVDLATPAAFRLASVELLNGLQDAWWCMLPAVCEQLHHLLTAVCGLLPVLMLLLLPAASLEVKDKLLLQLRVFLILCCLCGVVCGADSCRVAGSYVRQVPVRALLSPGNTDCCVKRYPTP
jgi:hypothetical protein